MKFYLAHPWEMKDEIRKWELEVEFKYGIDFLNPFFDIKRLDIEEIVRGKNEPRGIYRKEDGLEIVKRDLELIEKSSGLVAFLELDAKSIGTPIEIFYSSHILNKLTYVITKTCKGHPWISGLATEIFNSKEDFEKYLFEKYVPNRDEI